MVQKCSRIAAIYDVHGNLPALEAVLADLESVNPDLLVVGGDVVAGPMPTEVLDRLAVLGESICFLRGNADREVVAAYDAGRYADATDVTGPAERVAAYAASKINRAHWDLLASFAERLVVEVEGVGQVLFCHGSPRSDEEIVTAATTEGRLREILAEVDRSRPRGVRAHARPVRSARRRQEGDQRWQRRDALSRGAGGSLLAPTGGWRCLSLAQRL
jgi:predicted phosphodiesterase